MGINDQVVMSALGSGWGWGWGGLEKGLKRIRPQTHHPPTHLGGQQRICAWELENLKYAVPWRAHRQAVLS